MGNNKNKIVVYEEGLCILETLFFPFSLLCHLHLPFSLTLVFMVKNCEGTKTMNLPTRYCYFFSYLFQPLIHLKSVSERFEANCGGVGRNYLGREGDRRVKCSFTNAIIIVSSVRGCMARGNLGLFKIAFTMSRSKEETG